MVSPAPSPWSLSPGDLILRSDLHETFGGRVQGGMTTSRTSPNIFLFADPAAGERHGYFDGWAGEHFHYTGKGRRGDQQMVDINLALSRHAANGNAVRLFRGARRRIRYLGQFALDPAHPTYRMDAPQGGSDEWREVIVFKLVPVGEVLREAIDDRTLPPGVTGEGLDAVVDGAGPAVTVIPVEQQHATTATTQGGPSESHEIRRREQTLVLRYTSWLETHGFEVGRLQIVPNGEGSMIRNDVFESTRCNLVEAKGSGSRDAVRMALGQVLDYGRFATDARRAVLLPRRPRPDLEALLTAHEVSAVWPSGDEFSDNADGAFT